MNTAEVRQVPHPPEPTNSRHRMGEALEAEEASARLRNVFSGQAGLS